MAQDILLICTAALVGSMMFFAIVVAPVVFKTLPSETAGRFLRAMFPRYYTWGVVVSLVGLVAAFWVDVVPMIIIAVVASLFLYAKNLLMPKINASRDAGLAGDPGAKRRFSQLHRRSVLINGLQIIALSTVFVHVAL